MTIKSLFFALIGTLTMSMAMATEDQGGDINQRSDDGKKQGKWVFFGKDRPEKGYPAEGKIEEGPYKDDRKEGTWVKYHNDGQTPKLKGEYRNNRPSGAYTKFYANGVVRETGTFSRSKYSGSLKRYHENGQLEYEANMDESGQEEGEVKYYYPNGQVEFEYKAASGLPTGSATRYYENGNVKEKISYGADGKVESSEIVEMVDPEVHVADPGGSSEKAPKIDSPRTKGAPFKPNAYNKVYNVNDEIWQDGNFRNGRLWDGKVYEYDSDGILLKVKVFKNGVYHSDGQL